MDTLPQEAGAEEFAPSSTLSGPITITIPECNKHVDFELTLFASRSEDVSETALKIYELIGLYFLKHLSQESYRSRFHTSKPPEDKLSNLVKKISSNPHIQVFGFAEESPYITPSTEEVLQLGEEWPQAMFIDIDGTNTPILPLPVVMASITPFASHKIKDKEITGFKVEDVEYSILAEASLTVSDDYQRLGLGMTILEYAINQAKEAGVYYIYANIEKNPGSTRLFEKLLDKGMLEKTTINSNDPTDHYYHIVGQPEDIAALSSIIYGKPVQTLPELTEEPDITPSHGLIVESLLNLPRLAKGMGETAIRAIFNTKL